MRDQNAPTVSSMKLVHCMHTVILDIGVIQ